MLMTPRPHHPRHQMMPPPLLEDTTYLEAFDLNVIAPSGHSAVDQQLLEDCLRMY